MAFRLLSGEPVSCESELGTYGSSIVVGEVRAVLARHLCLELERVQLVSVGALLEDNDTLVMEDSCITVQVMPDPLEAQFASALGVEHFTDLLK
ncbi:Plant intracellular Ras-group-related LRR protein 5, partial [Durusdinium trenchii]